MNWDLCQVSMFSVTASTSHELFRDVDLGSGYRVPLDRGLHCWAGYRQLNASTYIPCIVRYLDSAQE